MNVARASSLLLFDFRFNLLHFIQNLFKQGSQGGRVLLMSHPLSGISGLSFYSIFLSALVILPSLVAPSVFSFILRLPSRLTGPKKPIIYLFVCGKAYILYILHNIYLMMLTHWISPVPSSGAVVDGANQNDQQPPLRVWIRSHHSNGRGEVGWPY